MDEVARGIVSLLDDLLGAVGLNGIFKHLTAVAPRTAARDENRPGRLRSDRQILRRGRANDGPACGLGLGLRQSHPFDYPAGFGFCH